MSRFECHSHSHYSNLRLLDSTNTVDKLINYAIDIGLAGICITDHECLSNSVEIDKKQKSLQETNPNFKIGHGNEIYLVENRDSNQQYYHFILIAKDKIGFKALKELSSNSWINSYYDRGMERVPTTKQELAAVVKKYGKGHLIASSACLGGEIDQCILEMDKAEKVSNLVGKKEWYDRLISHINYCLDLFGEDFYLECQPAQSKEQLIINNKMQSIADYFGIKIIITTDAHYLTKNDREVHKAYLNSKGGEREVDSFYEFAYLQTTEEIIENLAGTTLDYYELEKNTLEIYDKIEVYSIAHSQQVPQPSNIEVPYLKFTWKYGDKYPTLDKLMWSKNNIDIYWVNTCLNKMYDLDLINDEYLSRLEEEASVKDVVGQRLETNMFAYPVFLQQMIDLFWKCGSAVGAGRGSAGAGLNHYLLGITQVDPIKASLPWWRYMNHDTAELGDIDLDLCPSKRETIFSKIRQDRGPLGCVQVCTFSTESTKSAILTACRGYRSLEYPDGIDVDTAQYLSSLIPQERGFLWPINDVISGNAEKGRRPVMTFVNEIKQYKGLLDIIINIEGLIKSRSIHASGVVFYDDDPYESACFMKATNGAIITQYSLHDAEYCGDVKYDMLVTEEMDIIVQCINMLQEHNYIEKDLSLREAYDKYVHPEKLPLKDDKLWDAIDSGDILALFQLTSMVGNNMVKRLQPRNVEELTACNALIRLMPEDLNETPGDKYLRFKSDINQWYDEMDRYGLSDQEKKVLEKYCLADYGVPSSQEIAMLLFMDKDICGFSLSEANTARRVISKKQMNKIPELKEKVVNSCKNPWLGKYVWEQIIALQMGYSFSRIHGYTYSLIACQAAYLATYFPSVYWNTAYLRVVAGLDDIQESELVDILEPEFENMSFGITYEDLPDRSGKIKRSAATDYRKVAKGVCDIINHGINVSLIDINKSGYLFEPDEENNRILYGLKAVNGVSAETVQAIISNRPYLSFEDFIESTNFDKRIMPNLIKSGAFDQFGERRDIMENYIWRVCEPKKRITMQNFNGLNERGLLPQELDFQKRVFVFNKALKKNCKVGTHLKIESNYYEFYEQFFDIDLLVPKDSILTIGEKEWKKLYDAAMLPAKTWITANKEELLKKLNNCLFQEMWDKYAEGNYSAWEMESLGFYYHNHELKNVNKDLYNIVEYSELSSNPVVDYTFKRNGRNIPIFKTYRICGTVIAKEDNKSIVTILTPQSGVVSLKFTRDYYAMYNKRISEVGIDGIKHVKEQGWFKRGQLIVVNGFRRDDTFVAKTYKKTNSHQLYKITKVNEDGSIEMTNNRYGDIA